MPTIVAVIALGGAVISGGAYTLIGSEVDDDGILREPFVLIPMAYTLTAVSGVSAALSLATRKR
ncbi:DUF3955 domain-containing protein [Synechococcus sp. RSCCF101]|uniref:DUF3955 domain-containing protein n=1 Tax=Synechococcus sp. RSCCF101 TaxID=2511069 RepID=UPI00177CB7D7|nr:DUF3955 domain-containing protein [Synechococcus sp. RSCCF101]